MAPVFNRRRALPHGVPNAIRDTVLASGLPPQPRVLDLGAGAGRIADPFLAANDFYVGLDLSFGMLYAFRQDSPAACLVQAEGAHLPFADASFDAVLLIQVLSGLRGWRHLLNDTIRVLRPGGCLVVGRVVAPDDGVDAQMKARLADMLAAIGVHPYRDKPREDAVTWLATRLPDRRVVTAATWRASRSPRAFIERHSGGVRFSALPEPIRQDAMGRLADWAQARYGALDRDFVEDYSFELIIHRLT